jgi:hypothetical protein
MKNLFLGLFLLWSCAIATAASLNVGADADVNIFTAGLNPGTPTGPDFVAGVNPHEGFSHGLLHFDVSAIPTNATIDSVSVTLTVVKKSSQSPGADSFDLFRVTRGWNEAEATWTSATISTPWAAAGGDVADEASASASFDTGASTFSSDGLVADVQVWVNGSVSNAGWLIRATSETSTTSARRFAAREWFDPSSQPLLAVTYHIPPPPVTIVNTRRAGDFLRFDFQAAPGNSYFVEFETQFDNSWQALTNMSVLSPSLVNVSDAVTNSDQRIYRVRITSP